MSELVRDEKIAELFIDFFKYDKGYEDWDEDEISMSANPDDFTEFLVKIRDVLAEQLDEDASQISINRYSKYYNSTKDKVLYRQYGTKTNMKVMEFDEKGNEV